MNIDKIISFVAFDAVVLAIYFLPTIIAYRREIATTGTLFVVNLLLGWTVIGWLFCVLWAASGATAAQDAFYKSQAAAPRDPPRKASSVPPYP